MHRERTKNNDIHLKFIWNMIELKEFVMKKFASEDNLYDMFTNSLHKSKFKHWLNLINFVGEIQA